MTLTPTEREYIASHINPSRIDVVAAKSHFAELVKSGLARDHDVAGAQFLVKWLEKATALGNARELTFSSTDREADVAKIAEWLTQHQVAAIALWELVHTGLLMPFGPPQKHLPNLKLNVVQTMMRSSAEAGAMFQRWEVSLPQLVRSVGSLENTGELSDGDLFVEPLEIVGLHDGVRAALREAVRCYRHNLIKPTLAMLCAAVEGATIELAQELARASGDRGRKLRNALEDRPTLAAVSRDISELYAHGAMKDVRRLADVPAKDFGTIVGWLDTLRESRNVLHWKKELTTPNTHDKVAGLLLTSRPYIASLYQIRNAVLAQFPDPG